METKRLLIADDSPIIVEDLVWRLEGSFQIAHCNDGYGALELLRSYRPDIVVLDLMMKGLDGIALINEFQAYEEPPKVLVTTAFMTPFVQRVLQRIDFDYLMYKPCDTGILADRIRELAIEPGRDILMSRRPQSTTAGMLSSLQISCNHKGFQYLKSGLEMCRQYPEASMTKTVYPAIGRQFNVRAETVERDIRRAIGMAWEKGNHYTWRMYFECDSNGTVPRPTNSVFISTLARRLSMLQRNQA